MCDTEFFGSYFSSFCLLNLLKPTGYVMHHQFNIKQFYILPTLFCIYLSKQRFLPCTTEMKSAYCAVRTGSLNKAACASSYKGLNSFLSYYFC